MILGAYEVLETIGRGGMGVVYRARHQETGQVVAIKVMTAAAAANRILCQRFEKELSAGRRLRHAHIVQGLAFGVQDGQPFLVMEYVEGQNLAERIKQEGPLPENEAVQILVQIAQGSQLAHQYKLIHRDIKPDNILLAKDGQAKLTDLGLVKDLTVVGTDLTWERTGLGTIAYVAPEQFENARNADVRSDIYGLGATLYHALTGIVPFQGTVNLVILKKKLTNDFVPPRRLVPSLTQRVDQAICRALDCVPGRRQSSCEEFAASLLAPGQESGPLEKDLVGPQVNQDTPVDLADDERRRALRFPTALGASCHPLHDARFQWQAEIQDISLTGIRFQLDRRFEPGALLAVEVLDQQANTLSLLCVKVRWARKVAAKKWALGGAFHGQLTQRELSTLLGDHPSTAVISALAPDGLGLGRQGLAERLANDPGARR